LGLSHGWRLKGRTGENLVSAIKVVWALPVGVSEHDEPELLTINAAAEVLGVSEQTLRRWDKVGKGGGHK